MRWSKLICSWFFQLSVLSHCLRFFFSKQDHWGLYFLSEINGWWLHSTARCYTLYTCPEWSWINPGSLKTSLMSRVYIWLRAISTCMVLQFMTISIYKEVLCTCPEWSWINPGSLRTSLYIRRKWLMVIFNCMVLHFVYLFWVILDQSRIIEDFNYIKSKWLMAIYIQHYVCCNTI